MTATSRNDGVTVTGGATARISIVALGMSLSVFFSLTFVICFLVALLVPDPMLIAWLTFSGATAVPNWWGLVAGLALSVVCGWYIALVFGTIYNYFAARFAS